MSKNTELRRVVVTGMGALCPIGNTVNEIWNNAKAGVNGIAPITLYDASSQKVKIAGEVKGFDPFEFLEKQEARKQERFTHFARVATMQAMEQSVLQIANEDPYRCGVAISSGIGSLDFIARSQDRGHEKGFDRVSPHYIPASITNSAAGNVAIQEGFRGECSCVVSACAGGTNALGEAMRTIRHGYLDVMIAGGAESCITPLGVGGFTVMRALAECDDPQNACKPFDLERSGFVIAEGAGIMVLEELEHALARGAEILGEICGYGYTCDAHHITAPEPSGQGAAASMRNAIYDAGLEPSQIGYINAHGTSTPMNDKTESAAIRAVFGGGTGASGAVDGGAACAAGSSVAAGGVGTGVGEAESSASVSSTGTDPLVSSTKSMTGHMLGATGAVEAIMSLCAIRDGFIPPNINYQTPDPDCDINLVANQGVEANFDYALSDNLGFGGHNASIVIGRYTE